MRKRGGCILVLLPSWTLEHFAMMLERARDFVTNHYTAIAITIAVGTFITLTIIYPQSWLLWLLIAVIAPYGVTVVALVLVAPITAIYALIVADGEERKMMAKKCLKWLSIAAVVIVLCFVFLGTCNSIKKSSTVNDGAEYEEEYRYGRQGH